MGKFSVGLVAGTMIGVGMMVIDKKTVKKAKKLMRRMPCNISWM